jgi:hypothetical protein
MRLFLRLSAKGLLGASLASLAACTPQGDYFSNPPVSSAPGLGRSEPQPPGSLPPGAVVNAPLVTPDGELLRVNTP